MKKIILLVSLIAGVCGPSLAGNVYTPGNQWPPNCGTSGLFLEATGNCQSTWASQSPPTSLLASTNTWTARQNFNGLMTFGTDGLEINTAGQFKSPTNTFDFLGSNGTTFLFRTQSAFNCWSDHVTCYQAQIGPQGLYGVITSQFGTVLQRLMLNSQTVTVAEANYPVVRVPTSLFEVVQDTSTLVGDNTNAVASFRYNNASQLGDLTDWIDNTGTTDAYVGLKGELGVGCFTLAQIQAKTPKQAGEIVCKTDGIYSLCVSTGTGVGAYVSPISRTTACQ